MKFKTFLAFSGIFIGVFIFSMAGYIYGTRDQSDIVVPSVRAEKEESSSVTDVPDTKPVSRKTVKKSKEAYILRENENKISLVIRYSNGDEQIHSEYDVPVNLLPKSDREKLQKGIEFDSVTDIIKFIEDYMG